MKLKAQHIEHHDFSRLARLPDVTRELEIEPKKLAFLIIDVENDFLSEGGMFHDRGVDVSAARQVIEPIKKVSAACRKAGAKVIYTRQSFRTDFCDMGRIWDETLPHEKPVGYLIKDTWRTAFVEELSPQDGDIIIEDKHLYSAFYQTDLEHILRALGIEVIMFAGMCTSICVESTLRDAFFRQFRCILLSDCAWDRWPDIRAHSEKLVKIHFGYVTSSEEVLKALGSMA